MSESSIPERYTGLRRHEKRIKKVEERLIAISIAVLELDRITSDYVKFRSRLSNAVGPVIDDLKKRLKEKGIK